ncbi:MAG: hypothetical protein HQ517_15315 [SAR324 cluster bacterium]|nr:hypothetical protein [SAR324 cluster bacterium]
MQIECLKQQQRNSPGHSTMINFKRMRLYFLLPFYSVLLTFLLNSCSVSLTDRFINEANRSSKAEVFFQLLDHEVEEANVSHKAYERIDGFPYLRTDRYQASLKDRLDTPARNKSWLLALQALDLEAREKEIMNLPWHSVLRMAAGHHPQEAELRKQLIHKTAEYSDILLSHDLQTDGLFRVLIENVRVPDDYSVWMRTFGLYPLVMPVVAYFTDGAYHKMRERNKKPPTEQTTHGEIVAYSPPAQRTNRMSIVREVYHRSNRDEFGLPRLSEEDKLQLALVFAPVLHQDVADSFDKPGEVVWNSNNLKVSSANPAVYFYYTASLFKDRPILQINYVYWTAGRLGPNSPAIERGELDGITLRISLDDAGNPIIVDGMNNCGCYHFFIPNKERLLGVIHTSWEFDPVIIDFLPLDFPEKPLGIRITSGWHQVEDVGTNLSFDRQEFYRLIPYNHLESISRGPNEFASMFDEQGVAIGSDRIEKYIFFSMGIPRVGAMRQRGHHPTKLVGRAHFDDPHLLDKNFNLK